MSQLNAVSLRNLGVSFAGHQVFSDVDLDVADGEWVNIVGPNGAGKTSLLRAVLGTIEFQGEVHVFGARRERALEWASRVAYVPQTPVIPTGITVGAYVLLGRSAHRGVFGKERAVDQQVVADLFERLKLGEFMDRTVDSLSGGERQRVVLARALAQQARVLILDEPTTALDLGHQQQVLELVDALRVSDGLTVLATLHDLTLAARYGDRMLLLADGGVQAEGPAADVLTVTNIARYFGADVRIIDDEAGPIIVPATTFGR
jgi:iron complex transport system ATP-binding protein